MPTGIRYDRVFIDGQEVTEIPEFTTTYDPSEPVPTRADHTIARIWHHEGITLGMRMKKSTARLLIYGWKASGPVRKKLLERFMRRKVYFVEGGKIL